MRRPCEHCPRNACQLSTTNSDDSSRGAAATASARHFHSNAVARLPRSLRIWKNMTAARDSRCLLCRWCRQCGQSALQKELGLNARCNKKPTKDCRTLLIKWHKDEQLPAKATVCGFAEPSVECEVHDLATSARQWQQQQQKEICKSSKSSKATGSRGCDSNSIGHFTGQFAFSHHPAGYRPVAFGNAINDIQTHLGI